MNYRLIALDLDGTLLNSKKEISPRTRAALAAARERGIVTVIATGRTPHSARLYSGLIGGGPVISCNGAGVLDENGEYIHQKGIPLVPLQRVLTLAREAGLISECYTPGGIVLDRPLAHAAAYFRWVDGRNAPLRAIVGMARLWRINQMKAVRNLLRWAEKPPVPPVLKLMLIGEPEKLQPVGARISREVPGLEISSSSPDNLEVTARGVSKGSGLELLGARLRIPRQAMIAIGDSANDLAMIRYVGLGVAMGNAADPVKAAAARLTATCDEDGVARLVEAICAE